MPNWKTYESSVRLLSAIIAAHPGMKLNYDEVGKLYGFGTKYKAVWDRMNQINNNARLLREAYDATGDTSSVELSDARPGAKDIAVRFGGDCTKSAVDNRFRRIKSDAKLINDAVKNGIDPITLNIGDTKGEAALSEIARCFGQDATPSSIQNVYKRQLGPAVKRVQAALANGEDPQYLEPWGLGGLQGSNDIAKAYGSDCTKTGLQAHFTRDINPNVQAIRNALSQNKDTKSVILVEGVRNGKPGKVRFYGSECTTSALKNHFVRDLVPNIKALKQAVENGQDPRTVVLMEGVRVAGGGKQIARCVGAPTKAKDVQNFFYRTIKHDVKLIHDTLAAGGNPLDVELTYFSGKPGSATKETAKHYGGGLKGNALRERFRRDITPFVQPMVDAVKAGYDPLEKVLISDSGKEIARCFGNGLKGGALSMQFQRGIKPNAKLILEALERGEDPYEAVPIGADAKSSSKELRECFGSDCSVGGLKFQFSTRIKADVKIINDARKAGIDCKDIAHLLGGAPAKGDNELSSLMGADTTPMGIRFQFDDRLKPMAKRLLEMREQGLDAQTIDVDSFGGKKNKKGQAVLQ